MFELELKAEIVNHSILQSLTTFKMKRAPGYYLAVRLLMLLAVVSPMAVVRGGVASAMSSALSPSEKSAVVQLFDVFPRLLTTGLTSQWNQTAIENICDWPDVLSSIQCNSGHVVEISMCVCSSPRFFFSLSPLLFIFFYFNG